MRNTVLALALIAGCGESSPRAPDRAPEFQPLNEFTGFTNTIEIDDFEGPTGGEDSRVPFSPGMGRTHVLGGATLLSPQS